MLIHSEGYKFRRGTGSPFDALAAVDMGVSRNKLECQWCIQCHDAVDVLHHDYNQHQVWAKKVSCKRCGHAIFGAVYFHAQNITTVPSDLYYKALDWAQSPEKITK